jgi:hypothetical protein
MIIVVTREAVPNLTFVRHVHNYIRSSIAFFFARPELPADHHSSYSGSADAVNFIDGTEHNYPRLFSTVESSCSYSCSCSCFCAPCHENPIDPGRIIGVPNVQASYSQAQVGGSTHTSCASCTCLDRALDLRTTLCHHLPWFKLNTKVGWSSLNPSFGSSFASEAASSKLSNHKHKQ